MDLHDISQIKHEYQQTTTQLQETQQHLDQLLLTQIQDKIHLKKNTEAILELKRLIQKTHTVSVKMASQVQLLDLEYSRVLHLTVIISTIQELRDLVVKSRELLLRNQLEECCRCVRRYLELETQKVPQVYSALPSTQDSGLLGENPVLEMQKIEKGLLTKMSLEFDECIKMNDPSRMLELFKLFPTIQQHNLGLELFGRYVSSLVKEHVKEGLKVEKSLETVISRLFEMVASMVDKQEQLVNQIYGEKAMAQVLLQVQEQTTKEASLLLEQYMEQRHIARWMRDIKEERDQEFLKNKFESQIDSRELDKILAELASICQKMHLFDVFCQTRTQIKDQKLYVKSQELVTQFVYMSDFFVSKSIDKALQIDSLDQGAIVNTSVDDVFYILKTTLMRGLATNSMDGLAALVNALSSTLEQRYLSKLQKQLSSLVPDNIKQFLIHLNNIDTSCDYIHQLVKFVEDALVHIGTSDQDRQKVKSCLETMSEYSNTFASITRTWIENYSQQQLKQKIKTMIQHLTLDLSYNLDEQQQQALESSRPFVKKFEKTFSNIWRPLSKQLTPNNLKIVEMILMEWITLEWERYILSTTTSFYGAQRLESDVRGVISLLASNNWHGRDKFTRLQQICLVLNISGLDELLEFWSEGSIQWKLKPGFVKKVLGTRYDLNKREIEALQLEQ